MFAGLTTLIRSIASASKPLYMATTLEPGGEIVGHGLQEGLGQPVIDGAIGHVSSMA